MTIIVQLTIEGENVFGTFRNRRFEVEVEYDECESYIEYEFECSTDYQYLKYFVESNSSNSPYNGCNPSISTKLNTYVRYFNASIVNTCNGYALDLSSVYRYKIDNDYLQLGVPYGTPQKEIFRRRAFTPLSTLYNPESFSSNGLYTFSNSKLLLTPQTQNLLTEGVDTCKYRVGFDTTGISDAVFCEVPALDVSSCGRRIYIDIQRFLCEDNTINDRNVDLVTFKSLLKVENINIGCNEYCVNTCDTEFQFDWDNSYIVYNVDCPINEALVPTDPVLLALNGIARDDRYRTLQINALTTDIQYIVNASNPGPVQGLAGFGPQGPTGATGANGYCNQLGEPGETGGPGIIGNQSGVSGAPGADYSSVGVTYSGKILLDEHHQISLTGDECNRSITIN